MKLQSDLLLFLLWKDEEEISTSPPVSEFVSDAFDSCKINEDDLRKEMEQLVLDKREYTDAQQSKLNWVVMELVEFVSVQWVTQRWGFSEETADWERELQEELQEYDVLADNENRDDNWDREIEEMLKEDS